MQKSDTKLSLKKSALHKDLVSKLKAKKAAILSTPHKSGGSQSNNSNNNSISGAENTDKKRVSQTELDALEKYLDKLWSKVGIDVEFTRHFIDRVNDTRNKSQISSAEIIKIYRETFKKYGKKVAQLGPDAEAVLTDLSTNINVPFVLNWNSGELELVAKTIMRKKNFGTSDPQFKV